MAHKQELYYLISESTKEDIFNRVQRIARELRSLESDYQDNIRYQLSEISVDLDRTHACNVVPAELD